MSDRVVHESDAFSAQLTWTAGGACLIAGPVVFCIVRLVHGDIPAGDPHASLLFVMHRSSYAAVHVTAALAMLVTVSGLMAMARALRHPVSWLIGRSAIVAAVAGWAVFTVESTSEGMALPVLARLANTTDAALRADLTQSARTIAEATYGPSLVAMALMIGIPLLLVGVAMVLDHQFPAWLGVIGAVLGLLIAATAVALFVDPGLIPGVVLYGVLGSVLAQLWLAAVGATMLRRRARADLSA